MSVVHRIARGVSHGNYSHRLAAVAVARRPSLWRTPESVVEEMRRAAFTSVARGCGFAMLAVLCVMVGLSFDPRGMFQAGGMLTLLVVLVLILKARHALAMDYRHTEMWLMLPDDFRPPERYAQWAATTVMRDAYFTFAKYTALISIVMWAIALLISLAGFAAQY